MHEVEQAAGADPRLDERVKDLKSQFSDPQTLEARARRVVESMALVPAGLTAGPPRAARGRRRVLRLAARRRGRPGVRHAPARRGPRGDHRPRPRAVLISARRPSGGSDNASRRPARAYHEVMPTRSNLQLARIFGIRVGVSVSWFVVLFFLIYWLSGYFHELHRRLAEHRLRGRRRRSARVLRVAHAARARPRARGAQARHPDRRHRPVVLRRAVEDAPRARNRGRGTEDRGRGSRRHARAVPALRRRRCADLRRQHNARSRPHQQRNRQDDAGCSRSLAGLLSSTRCCSCSTSSRRSRSTAAGSPER